MVTMGAPTLEEDAPWTWSMRDVRGLLDQRQVRYVDLVQRTFRVKQANGRVVEYDMQPYQAWFHAHSVLAMGSRAPDRLTEKGRGLGFTLMTAMDALLLAHRTPRIKIPVAGRQGRTSDEFIEKAWDLIDDSTVHNDSTGDAESFFDADPNLRSEIHFTGNGAQIIPIPGGNPDSIRSMRSPMSVYDEFAFHKLAQRLMRAGGPVHSEGGQRTILSTHDGSGTVFYELVEKARRKENEFKLFYVPIHDPDAYTPFEPISKQLAEGRIRLVAPWLAPVELDKQLRDDPAGYEQENLCRVIDDALLLLTGGVVDAATDLATSWERLVTLDDARYLRVDEVQPRGGRRSILDELIVRRATVPVRPSASEHQVSPVNVGVDFASTGDLAAFTAHECTPDGEYQRWLLTLRGADTAVQDALLTIVEGTLRHTTEVIDKTGPGTGLAELRARRASRNVLAMDFGGSTELSGVAGTVRVKKALAVNGLAPRITSRRLHLLAHPHPLAGLQRKHLTAIRRADLDAPRLKTEGHADIFWANALATWASIHSGGESRAVREGTSRFRDRDPFGERPSRR